MTILVTPLNPLIKSQVGRHLQLVVLLGLRVRLIIIEGMLIVNNLGILIIPRVRVKYWGLIPLMSLMQGRRPVIIKIIPPPKNDSKA